MFPFKRNKKSSTKEERVLQKIAVTPASVSVHMIEGEVRDTVYAYLTAMYSLDVSKLPMIHMDERLYNIAGHYILDTCNSDLKRTVDELNIDHTQLTDYDNHHVYMVSSLTFNVSYSVSGSILQDSEWIPYSCSEKCSFRFNYDGRMGWLLSECN